jgi:hypothetical protein
MGCAPWLEPSPFLNFASPAVMVKRQRSMTRRTIPGQRGIAVASIGG